MPDSSTSRPSAPPRTHAQSKGGSMGNAAIYQDNGSMEMLSQSIATFPTTPWEPVRGLNMRALLDGSNVLALQQERADVVNFTQEDSSKLASWLPRTLHAKKVVFLPNVHQGKSLLPTGSVVLTGQKDWHQFAVNDCGCGMRLIQSHVEAEDLSQRFWDRMANALRKRRGGFGDMGGRSHFLTALVPQEGGHLVFLMHTGSRIESGLLDDLVDQPEAFEAEASRLQMWASDNRSAIHDEIETIFGNTQLLVDLPHNAYEKQPDGDVIIRRGAVRVQPGEVTILPSSLGGDATLVRAKATIKEALSSFSHGTGRHPSHTASVSAPYDFGALREKVLIPAGVADSALQASSPNRFRDLDEFLSQTAQHIEVLGRFRTVAYMGHL